MTDLVLDRAVMTQDMLSMLMSENQKKMLIHLVTKPVRPLFLPTKSSVIKRKAIDPRTQLSPGPADNELSALRGANALGTTERELQFIDIVEAALEKGQKSEQVKDLIKMMKSEVERGADSNHLNYFDLF